MDRQVKLIFAKGPEDFEKQVNDLLSQGNWRVAETEMSVTDNQFDAMLIQSFPEPLIRG